MEDGMISRSEYLIRYSNGTLSKGFRERRQALKQASIDDRSGPIPIALVQREGTMETTICAGDALSAAIRELQESLLIA
jgi:hypothetical protein